MNTKSRQGYSAMTISSRYGHLSSVQYLLNHGAQVTIFNNNGWTLLLKAARGGHPEVVDHLPAHDAEIRRRHSGRQVAPAPTGGRTHIKKSLIILEGINKTRSTEFPAVTPYIIQLRYREELSWN